MEGRGVEWSGASSPPHLVNKTLQHYIALHIDFTLELLLRGVTIRFHCIFTVSTDGSHY